MACDALSEQRAEIVLAHLGDCPKCQAAVEEVAGTRSFRREFFFDEPPENGDESRRQAFLERIKGDSFPGVDQGESTVTEKKLRETDLTFLAPSEKEGSIGKLGAFEVSEVIGRGGMGLVLRAHDPELQRDIAIKVLAPALAASKTARERFMREARAAAAIDHENVLPIYSVDRTGELPYFTMPVVEGKSLQSHLDDRRSPLPIEEIVRIGSRVASGLAAAHEQDLIHRDIKPANILLDPDGDRVWLADFGLARAVEDQSVTVPGSFVGTPQFMAPEQLDDKPSTTRSDLFSLGTVFYYMATGNPPFAGKSTASLIRKIIDFNPPSPADVNGSLPRWLSEVIVRLLQKNPSDRPKSAEEVARTIQSNWHRSARRKSGVFLGVTLGCAIVATVAALFFALDETEPGPFRLVSSGHDFATLAEAVEQSEDGAVIEITQPYIRLDGAVDVGSKSVTLRSAGDLGRCVIDFTTLPNQPTTLENSPPIIETGGNLTLEDLTLARVHATEGNEVDPGYAPLIKVDGAGLSLENCRFELQQSRSSAPLAAIVLSRNREVSDRQLHVSLP